MGYTPYSGPRVAGLSDIQRQGMETAYQNILSGNTPAQAAGGMLNKTLQGGYSLDNPYLDQVSPRRRTTDQFNRNILSIKTAGVQSGMYTQAGRASPRACGWRRKEPRAVVGEHLPRRTVGRGRQIQAATLAPSLSN